MNNLDDKILMIENKIDDVDSKMVELLEKRLKLSGEEALLKKERGMPVPDLVRVRTKTEKLVADAREDMAHYRKLCYMALNELTYDYQRRVTLPESEIYKSVKNALEQGFKSFPEKAVVACQGVQGAYQQKACDKLFSMPKIMYMKNFNGVFAAVDKGLCRYGVLPLENSTAGSVNSVYDLLSKYKCYIVRSVRLKIDHSLLAKKGTKIEDIKEISFLQHPQSMLGVFHLPTNGFKELSMNQLVLALDGVQDPGNLGTIIRVADWFGIKDIYCSHDTADCWNPKVVQATMGSIARVQLHYVDLNKMAESLPADYPIYATLLDGENIYKQELSHHGMIVMGNEGKGISPLLRTKINRKLYIPSYSSDGNTAESLNVAIATSIVCAEFRRR